MLAMDGAFLGADGVRRVSPTWGSCLLQSFTQQIFKYFGRPWG